jgi:hypothetical protein
VETATVEKNDGEERQRTAVRFVNMEKHCTHKNVSSMERERERERESVCTGDRSGRQIRRRNETASQRETRTVVSDRERERENVCAGDRGSHFTEREREREATGWRGNENFISPQLVFRSEINEK